MIDVDLLVLQQGQWSFGQLGFQPTVQALNHTAFQKERRTGRKQYTSIQDCKQRKFLNVQRFEAGYLGMASSRVFREECPSLQPNFNLKFPMYHRLAMVRGVHVFHSLCYARYCTLIHAHPTSKACYECDPVLHELKSCCCYKGISAIAILCFMQATQPLTDANAVRFRHHGETSTLSSMCGVYEQADGNWKLTRSCCNASLPDSQPSSSSQPPQPGQPLFKEKRCRNTPVDKDRYHRCKVRY